MVRPEFNHSGPLVSPITLINIREQMQSMAYNTRIWALDKLAITQLNFSTINRIYGDICLTEGPGFHESDFIKIYNQLPNSHQDIIIQLISEVKETITCNLVVDRSNAENIIRTYMELAEEVADNKKRIAFDIQSSLLKYLNRLSLPMPTVQDVLLALLWGAMIWDLDTFLLCRPSDDEKKELRGFVWDY